MVRAEPPFLITDPYFEGGKKFTIKDADARAVFALLKGRFEKGVERDFYKIVLDVEPYLQVRRIRYSYPYTFIEASVKQIDGDVSVHLVVYCWKTVFEDSLLYIECAKYLFTHLGRDMPSEVLEALNYYKYLKQDEEFNLGLLIFFSVLVGIIAVCLMNVNLLLGLLFMLIPVFTVCYSLFMYKNRRDNA